MNESTVETVAQVFIAVGTVAVAVLAIWGEKVRALLAGPKLELQLRDIRGNLTSRTGGPRTIYYHLRVSNKRKWSPAKSVRILLTSLAKKRADGSFYPDTLIAPLQLTWAYPNFHELLPTIADEDTCDVGFLDENARRFSLSTYITPNNFQGFVTPNEAIQIHVIATAHNYTMKKPLVLEISWDGQWSDNMDTMNRHLVIREVTKEDVRQA
ncbi:hypothetical protein KAU87_04800 [Candidatus Bathyarchaeota archaeon]|nr:hypothetical protein [Candidatus Bathyarchaeota archaeon]